jgi:iron complex outermembrane receptor protein
VDSNRIFSKYLLRETDFKWVANLLETGFRSQDTKRYESDYYIQDVIYSFDNVSVGYTFNQNRIKLQYEIDSTAQNVLVITKYSGLDPEIGGIDNNLIQDQ